MRSKMREIRHNLILIKLGIFVIGAVFLLSLVIFSIRKISVFEGSYLLKVKFDFVEGIKPASPVRFCGVNVGEVKKLEVREEKGERPVVYVYASIQNGVNIPRGSRFFINSLTLFGEKYLEISPPDDGSKGGYYNANEVIEGITPPPLFDVLSSVNRTMSRIDNFINNEEFKSSLEDALANIKDATYQVKELVSDIRNRNGTVGRLLYDDSLYQTAEEFLADLKAHPWKLLYKPKDKRIRSR